MKTYVSTKYNTYHSSPTYADGTEVCDAIVICGGTAILDRSEDRNMQHIPRLASKGPLQFDVAAEFEKVFGFSLADYTNFMFSLLLHAMMERDARQANADPPSPVGPYWLKKTTLSEETIHKILATVSFSLDAITPPKRTARVCGFHIPAR